MLEEILLLKTLVKLVYCLSVCLSATLTFVIPIDTKFGEVGTVNPHACSELLHFELKGNSHILGI